MTQEEMTTFCTLLQKIIGEAMQPTKQVPEQKELEFEEIEEQPTEQPIKKKRTRKTKAQSLADTLLFLREYWKIVHIDSIPFDSVDVKALTDKYKVGRVTRNLYQNIVMGDTYPTDEMVVQYCKRRNEYLNK